MNKQWAPWESIQSRTNKKKNVFPAQWNLKNQQCKQSLGIFYESDSTLYCWTSKIEDTKLEKKPVTIWKRYSKRQLKSFTSHQFWFWGIISYGSENMHKNTEMRINIKMSRHYYLALWNFHQKVSNSKLRSDKFLEWNWIQRTLIIFFPQYSRLLIFCCCFCFCFLVWLFLCDSLASWKFIDVAVIWRETVERSGGLYWLAFTLCMSVRARGHEWNDKMNSK